MTRSLRRAVMMGLVVAGAAAATARVSVPSAPAQVMVPTKDPAHPRIRYADSLVSMNDRCMVRQGTMNPMFKPVYVNGRPVGFC